MDYKKFIDKAKQTIDEDKFDIKGKSKKLAKGVGKRVATAEGAAGIGAGTAAAMTTTSLGLKGAFLGSFVAINASTVGVPIAAAAGYMAVRTAKSFMLEKKNKKLKEKRTSRKFGEIRRRKRTNQKLGIKRKIGTSIQGILGK